jgi:hypothetical protein
MNSDEFFKLQYQTLRDEIKDTKARIFQILSIGFTLLPAAHFLGYKYDIGAIILFAPVLISAFALLYLSENRALMRCGYFIRCHLETHVDGIQGWEHWLESPKVKGFDPRGVDKYSSYAFYLLFLIYYVLAVVVAAFYCFATLGSHAMPYTAVLLATYGIVGILFVYFLAKNIQTSTTTRIAPGNN